MTSHESNHDAARLVRKLWHYCNVLRDDGLSYPDYVEQLTYLLFLKMSDEQHDGPVPDNFGWRSLVSLHADEMHLQYTRILDTLGEERGLLGLIFSGAKNKIGDPEKLRLLIVDLIGQTMWTGLQADVKGDAYEGLLEKNARDTKSGAGQYFTPRPLIDAIVECVDPQIGETVCDPACGTGGFLLAAVNHVRGKVPDLSHERQSDLAAASVIGVELVEEVARLATMNLVLHGIGGTGEGELPIACRDSLRQPPGRQFDVVLTNPPFGTRGTVTYRGEGSGTGDSPLTIERRDFWVETANKQLNFLQHVVALLKPGGRAAVVVPDNVLFEEGAAASIRRRILERCRVRSILRLPSGLFYAHGVKSNVLFFERGQQGSAEPVSGSIWVYDLRSHRRFSVKTNPIQRDDLDEFVQLYRSEFRTQGADETHLSSRLREFCAQGILATRGCRLDFTWDTDAVEKGTWGLARVEELSELVAEDLERALGLIRNIGR